MTRITADHLGGFLVNVLLLNVPGQTEVRHLAVLPLANQNVSGCEITMHDLAQRTRYTHQHTTIWTVDTFGNILTSFLPTRFQTFLACEFEDSWVCPPCLNSKMTSRQQPVPRTSSAAVTSGWSWASHPGPCSRCRSVRGSSSGNPASLHTGHTR